MDVLAMHCAALPAARAVGFKGTEALCRPFEFDVLFTVPAGTDVRAAINAPATLTLQRGADSPPMCWHGVFVRLRLLRESADRALYHGSLVPRLWLQRHAWSGQPIRLGSMFTVTNPSAIPMIRLWLFPYRYFSPASAAIHPSQSNQSGVTLNAARSRSRVHPAPVSLRRRSTMICSSSSPFLGITPDRGVPSSPAAVTPNNLLPGGCVSTASRTSPRAAAR